MPSLRTVAVVNPRAQNGALARRWPELRTILRREIGGVEELMTDGPGDATRLAAQAVASGADTVIAVGGDGTIGEVAGGFFAGKAGTDAALAIIPVGTGGDFRRSLALPDDPAACARIVAAGRRRRIDVGRVEHLVRGGGTAGRVFINIASFGLSGLVDELVNKSSKVLGGRLSFLLASARAGLQFHNPRVRLTFDDDAAGAVDATISTVAIANGRYFGGGMHMAPAAALDDGLFDVVSMGDLGKLELLQAGPRIYAGSHLGMAKVSSRRARVVHAAPIGDAAVALDIDGETPGILPATFRVVPSALSVIAP